MAIGMERIKEYGKKVKTGYRGWITVVLANELPDDLHEGLPDGIEKVYGPSSTLGQFVGLLPFSDYFASNTVYRMRTVDHLVSFLRTIEGHPRCFVAEILFEGHGGFAELVVSREELTGENATRYNALTGEIRDGTPSIYWLTYVDAEDDKADRIERNENITELLRRTCFPAKIQLYCCLAGGNGDSMARILSLVFADCSVSGYRCTIPTWYDYDIGVSVAHLTNSDDWRTFVNGAVSDGD